MNDPVRAIDRLLVRKRDGQIEALAVAKLVECLRRVLHDERDADPPATSQGLVETVVQYLARGRFAAPVPSVQISELLAAVLVHTGHAPAAQLLRLHTRWRDRQRRKLHVARRRPSLGRYVNRRWSKGAIVASLKSDYDIGTITARSIAANVENAVLRSELPIVTTGLIREVIQSELLGWGLADEALAVSQRLPRTRAAAQPREAGSTE